MQLARGQERGHNGSAGSMGRDAGAVSLDGHGLGGTKFQGGVNTAGSNSDEEDLGERQE